MSPSYQASIWRYGIQWWAFALFSLVPFIVAALYIAALFSGEAVDCGGLAPIGSAIPMLVILIIFAGFGGEFG